MNLKFLLSTAAFSALCTSPAFAADMALKAPARAAPFSWTGFYVGANVGGAWGSSSVRDDGTGTFGTFFSPAVAVYGNDPSGIVGGIQAGYNWQASMLVFGIEADFDWLSASKNTLIPTQGVTFSPYSSELSTLGTIRGRVGAAFDRLLVYGTGGAAHANLKNEFVDTVNFPVATIGRERHQWGWAAGGGVEYAFANNWTAKAEYLHASFGSETVASVVAPGGYIFTFKDSVDVVRAGINYKF